MMSSSAPTGYALSRDWFDFAFKNEGIVSGNHGCMYLWFVEKNNRRMWVDQFAAPRDETMAAVGITSYNTYRKVFNDLVSWGFVRVVKESKNQYSAHIIALSKNDSPLIQAEVRLEYKPESSTDTGIVTDTVVIKNNINIKSKKDTSVLEKFSPPSLTEVLECFKSKIKETGWSNTKSELEAQKFFDYYESIGWLVGGRAKMKKWTSAAANWIRKSNEDKPPTTNSPQYTPPRPHIDHSKLL